VNETVLRCSILNCLFLTYCVANEAIERAERQLRELEDEKLQQCVLALRSVLAPRTAGFRNLLQGVRTPPRTISCYLMLRLSLTLLADCL
jgi:hypothetical protein